MGYYIYKESYRAGSSYQGPLIGKNKFRFKFTALRHLKKYYGILKKVEHKTRNDDGDWYQATEQVGYCYLCIAKLPPEAK